MNRGLLTGLVLTAVAASAQGAATASRDLRLWQLEGDQVLGAEADRPLPVGSLQKPFVVEAWASAHPGQVPGLAHCDEYSHCWRPGGHGTLGLERAVALSCNTYFRQLAAEIPASVLAATLRGRGFDVHGTLTPELAIGLSEGNAAVTITPEGLLLAYRDLTRVPWTSGEAVRQRLLLGLRAAAREGTARGLGQRGYWAKTGTVPALDGQALRTSGWALAIDDTGFGLLGLLARGTGREAAEALQPVLARLRPWASVPAATRPARAGLVSSAPRARGWGAVPAGQRPLSVDDVERRGVRVRLFDALRPQDLRARNLQDAPVASSAGFVGGGAQVTLRPGLRLGNGLWELSLPEWGLVRRVKAALDVQGTDTRPVVVASLSAREYVQGVLAAEVSATDLHTPAAAAVLRYLLQGSRHTDADVCDRTHCAFFVGRGPRVTWLSARLPVLLRSAPGGDPGALEDWPRVLALARGAGPATWSSHCGGEPLSAFYVWGAGDRRVFACRRHPPGSVPAWHRAWPTAALERVFGGPVRGIRVDDADGTWGLRIQTRATTRLLRFDEAHRMLAAELGWDALPSPARSVERGAAGFQAEGVGFGHRVGLCLDGPDATRVADTR